LFDLIKGKYIIERMVGLKECVNYYKQNKKEGKEYGWGNKCP
jgi:hypothetical protein